MLNRPYRFLVVSYGSIGKRHFCNLRLLYPDADIAVLSLTGSVRHETANGPTIVFGTVEEATAFRPDVTVVACPATAHERIAIALAQCGSHLLIEKPLAHNLEAAGRIAEAAEQAGVTCLVGYNLRFRKSLIRLREIITAERYGRVIAVNIEAGQLLSSWRPQQDYRNSVSARNDLGGGALLELSHELDYALWIFGKPDRITSVMGTFSNLEIDVEDVVDLVFEFGSPPKLISVRLDFLQHTPTRRCSVHCTSGTLVWDAITDTITVHTPGEAEQPELIGPFEMGNEKTYVDELTYLMQCIEERRRPSPGLRDGMDVMALIAAARKSSVEGKALVPEFPDHD